MILAKRYPQAYKFIQLLWVPQVGDRVFCNEAYKVFGGGQVVRARDKRTVTKVEGTTTCYVEGLKNPVELYNLSYRVRPHDVAVFWHA